MKSAKSVPDFINIKLAECFNGCERFQLRLNKSIAGQNGVLEIVASDAHEADVIRKRLYVRDMNGNKYHFDNKNQLILPQGDIKFMFDGKSAGKIKDGKYKRPGRRATLPEVRMIADVNSKKTAHNVFTHHHHAHQHEKTNRRTDGHTHYVATFPMKSALEKAMELHAQNNKKVFIPSLVIIEILKNRNIINENNQQEWLEFLSRNKVMTSSPDFAQKKEFGDTLVKEDMASVVEKLSETEKNACISDDLANYIEVAALKEKLGESQWGNFCNGFDLSATHACDFTQHMEASYNLRNWFGKDITFLRAQLEVIYEEYERNGINYAELPASFFKSQKDLNLFVKMTKEIEERRALSGQFPITLRPGLSIARLTPPTQFRVTLFNYIPLILQNPELASVSVLAHETNPTTEHILAIEEFLAIINKHRPGFTVEVHAGETAAYGEVNMREAVRFAKNNPLTMIRAGHATYGDHSGEAMDNFVEEKCPMSNLTLINIEPKAHVSVLLGIAEGRSRIFWGSDGTIYNPEYGPEKQKEIFAMLMSHHLIIDELRIQFKEGNLNTFGKNNFDEYMVALSENLIKNLQLNENYEDKYIQFKADEKDYYSLYINHKKLTHMYSNPNMSDDIKDLLEKTEALLQSLNPNMNQMSFSQFQQALRSHIKQIQAMNVSVNLELNKIPSELQSLRLIKEGVGYMVLPDIIFTRQALEYFNRLVKLRKCSDAEDKIFPIALKRQIDRLTSELETKDKQEKLSPDECEKIRKLIDSIDTSLKNDLDRLMHSKVDKMKLKAGNTRVSIFLDPNYYNNRFSAKANRLNKENLQSKAYVYDADRKSGIVIFGNPEQSDNPAKQDQYMESLYKNIFVVLKRASDENKEVILLGSTNEGINPLVYKVLNDHPELKARMQNPRHVISNDEHVDNIRVVSRRQDSQKGVAKRAPYYTSSHPKQEAHVGFANFIAKMKSPEVMVFGGDAALWYDARVALSDVKLKNPIMHYADGFHSTRSSSEFVRGNPNQGFNNATAYIKPLAVGRDLSQRKYFDYHLLTTPYHRNLEYAFNALSFLCKLYDVSLNIDLKLFLSVYNPSHESVSSPRLFNRVLHQRKAVKEGLEAVIGHPNANDEFKKEMINIFTGEQGGYNVINKMKHKFKEFDVVSVLQSALQQEKPTNAPE